MNRLSLRTKGLLFIVLISLIPLLLAGIGNYLVVKKAMIKSEIEKTSSKLSIRANDLSSWMAVRQAEVLVMSRTHVVRFGTDEERLAYFGRELLRSDFTYYTIGYVDKAGNSISSDGIPRDMSNVLFFEEAVRGNIVITDPDIAMFSKTPQSFIAVPVYGEKNEVTGVVYASILYSTLTSYVENPDSVYELYLMNDNGKVMYGLDALSPADMDLANKEGMLYPVANEILNQEQGTERVTDGSAEHVVFYAKVDSVPWRFVLKGPASMLEVEITPILWRNILMIGIAELLIVFFFSLYFDRIIKRLEQILHATEQASDGNLDAEHLDESVGDEIGKLARSVNGMMVKLQQSFDQLSAIINQNQYGFIVLNEDYKITYVNKMAEQMLGYQTDELVGHATPLLFLDLEQITERAEMLSQKLGREVLPGLDVFRELRNESFSYETEWIIIRKDGSRVPTIYSSNGLRDRNGRFSGVVVMLNDISDRKLVENARNRLLTIVESAKDLIVSTDTHGNFIYSNQAGNELLGITNGAAREHNVSEYMNEEMYQAIKHGIVIAKEHGFWEHEIQFIRKDGQIIDASIVVVVHHDELTGELYYSAIARDITEQKHVLEELVRARQEAEDANETKGRFLALMSHEIRTPLNGIIGLTSLMQKSELPPYQRDYMDKINTSSEMLLRIINDVLDFSKIEAGKIDVERHPFQPSAMLRRVTDQISLFLGGKEQFEVLIDSPKNVPQALMGDALRLEQVLINLCINAIKFTEKGMVTLKIEMLHMDKKQVYFRFSVSDTGIGMSKEQLNRLFKPFTQADGSTTRKFGGTGLGLVISKSFVELMGGKLEVESELDKGSRFFFTLPFNVINRNTGQLWAANQYAKEQPVWIIEDNDIMQEHWSEIVEDFGMTPIVFHSWKRATDRLSRIGRGAAPLLILADMEMPDMYGMDTWLDLQKNADSLGVKVIAMTTTYGRDEMLLLPQYDRPITILVKPITRAILLQSLSRATDSQMTIEELSHREVSVGLEHRTLEHHNGSARILLAEDNRVNQLVAKEMIKELGYEYGLAENGEQVLRMLEEDRWDLILMDIHMPVMDGSEATKLIRNQSQYDSIPIIAVTANTLKEDHEEYLRLGMSAIITKPIDMQRLESVITSALLQMTKLKRQELLSLPALTAESEKQAGSMANEQKRRRTSSVIDIDAVLERLNGKQCILVQMLKQFRIDYEAFTQQLQHSLKQGDQMTAVRLMHTLKGAAGNLSAYGVFEASAEYERLLKEQSNEQDLQAAAAVLNVELLKLLEVTSNILQTFEGNP